jgi:hypothetical protein
MFTFRPFISSLNAYVLVNYDIEESEDELDVKLKTINGQTSSARGTFAGLNHVEIYNLALRDYFTNHARHEFEH